MTSRLRKKVLVTVGPTRAFLDSIRYLSNISTGELGYLLCDALSKIKKIETIAVCGPNCYPFVKLNLKKLVEIETTEQMLEAVLKSCTSFKPEMVILVAAVLDFTPLRKAEGKTSSSLERWSIDLVPTPKIIDAIDSVLPRVRKIGFKLEYRKLSYEEERELASQVIREKRLELLCLNYVKDIGRNRYVATLYSQEGQQGVLKTKVDLARWLSEYVSRTV